jgi:hypothetical protein
MFELVPLALGCFSLVCFPRDAILSFLLVLFSSLSVVICFAGNDLSGFCIFYLWRWNNNRGLLAFFSSCFVLLASVMFAFMVEEVLIVRWFT